MLYYYKEEGLFGILDEDGNVIYNPIFEGVRDYKEGFMLVFKSGRGIYLNYDGKIETMFENVQLSSFKNGMCVFGKGGKYGYFNKRFKVKVAPKYSSAFDFYNDAAVVEYEDKWGAINKKGEEIIELRYDYLGDCIDEYFVFERDDKMGYLNKSGREIIPPKYDDACDMIDNRAFVCVEDKWGIVNERGEEILKPILQDCDLFKPDFTFVEGMSAHFTDGRYALLNKKGEIVIPTIYDNVSPFEKGVCRAVKDGKDGFIDKYNREIFRAKKQLYLPYHWF